MHGGKLIVNNGVYQKRYMDINSFTSYVACVRSIYYYFSEVSSIVLQILLYYKMYMA